MLNILINIRIIYLILSLLLKGIYKYSLKIRDIF